jgi:predicted RNase H-like nuclease (RuvC/YqgF family)
MTKQTTQELQKSINNYYEGKGCTCYARSQGECACDDVDWTPKEVYVLKVENLELQAENLELRKEVEDLKADKLELREQVEFKISECVTLAQSSNYWKEQALKGSITDENLKAQALKEQGDE